MARRGLSPVIAVTIMTGIMLTIVAVALYFSTSLIDLNRQMMEYEYAKEQLTYAATALEQVAFGTGGARYVRFSLVSTGIDLAGTLPVEVYANGVKVFGGTLATLEVCGGPLVTTAPRLLYPEGGVLSEELGKLVVGGGEPVVIVYENFSGRACAFLQPRVRVVYNIQLNVTEGGVSKCYNVFTLHVLNLTRGVVGGAGTIPVIFRNTNTTVTEYRLGGTSLGVSVKAGGKSYSLTVEGPQTCGSKTVDGSILVVVKSDIVVSTVP